MPDTREREVVNDATLAAAATPIMINDTTYGHEERLYSDTIPVNLNNFDKVHKHDIIQENWLGLHYQSGKC